MPANQINWSAAEIEATVDAYADLYGRQQRGELFVKRDSYRELSQQYNGRKLTAYARRFSNISHVLLEMGLEFLPGMGPQANMGTRAETIIREVIARKGYFGVGGLAPVAVPPVRTAPSAPRPRPAGNRQPLHRQVTVVQAVRDQAVVDWVLEQAAGHCECCGQPAPFLREDGTPFLEVHHVKWLAQGGSDTVSNAVALCPNCHRQLHHGAGAVGLVAQLVLRVERLVAE